MLRSTHNPLRAACGVVNALNPSRRERARTGENPGAISKADLVVGIPCSGKADSLAHATRQAASALADSFGHLRPVIIACDDLPSETAAAAFLTAETDIPKIYLPSKDTAPGKTATLRLLLQEAVALDPAAVVLVDPDVMSLRPEWLKDLAKPLFGEYELVLPLYMRDKNDGVITNHLAYPLTRALYGRRIRQPLGREFGLSGRLAREFVESRLWDDAVGSHGTSIWVTTLGVANDVPVCQVFLGGPRVHRDATIPRSLEAMVRDIVVTIFRLMRRLEDRWKGVRWSKPTPIFGLDRQEAGDPPPVTIAEEELYERFSEGFVTCAPFYERMFDAEFVSALKTLHAVEYERFDFSGHLWARTVYEFAAASRAATAPIEDLVASFFPLFAGRLASYARITKGMDTRGVEDYLEHQCLILEEAKPYLLERWFGS